MQFGVLRKPYFRSPQAREIAIAKARFKESAVFERTAKVAYR
jgi:hypothetical protein